MTKETKLGRYRRLGQELDRRMPRHNVSDEEKIYVFDGLKAIVTEIPYKDQ